MRLPPFGDAAQVSLFMLLDATLVGLAAVGLLVGLLATRRRWAGEALAGER